MFGLLDPPLFLLTAAHGGKESGMIATWVMSIALTDDKKRIAVVLSPEGQTCELIGASGRFVAHLMAEGQHDLVPQLGLRSGHTHPEKLAGLDLRRSASGLAVVAGCCGWGEYEVEEKFIADERTIFVARGIEEHEYENRKPLTLAAVYSALPEEIVRAIDARRKRDAKRDPP